MNFKPISKNIYNYSNGEKGNYKKKHIIENLRLYCEYEVVFSNNNFNLTDSSFLCINKLKEDNSTETIYLDINKPYKFINRDIVRIEVELCLSEDSLIHLYILEKPIEFKENTYENSSILKDFINKIDKEPDSVITIPPSFDVKVACILDEFTYECLSYEVELLQLKSTTWLTQIEKFKPNLLLVESAWYGICRTWIGKVACEDRIDNTILDLINYCKENNIITVFFNKEGLVNYSHFKYSSSIFDYIFVSDENIIAPQKSFSNHNKIYTLSFAAQPKIHNSINKNKYTLGEIAFAGGWYSNKHPDRIVDFEYILKPALDYGVHIYDRNYHQRSILEFTNKYWPKEYLNNILGRLEYKYMVKAYKNYSIFLNVNSVQNSSCMISRRVYEILACKTMVLSSYSQGINHVFKDYIFISKNKENTVDILDNLLNNSLLCSQSAKKAQRYVLENHTYKERLAYMFDIINLNYKKSETINVISIFCISSIDQLENLNNILYNQNYVSSFTYLIVNKDIGFNNLSNLTNAENLSYYYYSSTIDIQIHLQHIYDSHSSTSYYAYFNCENYYAPNYIRDYVNTLSFVNADVIGKSTIFSYNKTFSNIDSISCNNKDSYVDSIYTDTIFFNYKYLRYLIDNPNLLSLESMSNNNQFIFYSDDEFNFLKDTCKEEKLIKSHIEQISI